jgi:hypothetical protein
VLAVRAQAPRAPDIVLQAGAADGRELRVAVAVHLHLTLAVPHALVEHAHANVAADESARTVESVGDDEIATLHGWVLAPERHMEIPVRVAECGLER